MKKIFIFIGILILVGFAYYLTFDKAVEEPLVEEESLAEEEPVGLANPASVFCFEQGGALETIEFPAGEDGLCVF